MSHMQKVIVLVDMDCFYCQVEEQLDPLIAGKPVAVVQYNAWQGGGLIAVNYPARDSGVKRYMRGSEAKKVCPEIRLVSVPTTRGKSDLTRYRDAGKRVADVFFSFTPIVERASVDEAYLDITEVVDTRLNNNYAIDRSSLINTHVVGCDVNEFVNGLDYNLNEHDYRLALGAVITEEIRTAVYQRTGYHCSAGIAHNKILAKLAAGMHKPNQQTILPQFCISELYQTLPITKIRSLGGKFGLQVSEVLGVKVMNDLCRFSERELQQKLDSKTGTFLYNIARGISHEAVTIRQKPKSIACSKNFTGPTALVNMTSLEDWVRDLTFVLAERLTKDYEEYNRKAKNIIVIFTYETNTGEVTNSRTHPLNSYEPPKIAESVLDILKKYCIKDSKKFKIKHLGFSASKFEDLGSSVTLKTLFQNQERKNTEDNRGNCSKNSNEDVMSSMVKLKYGDNNNFDASELAYDTCTNDSNDIYMKQTYDSKNEVRKDEINENESLSESDSITNETFYEPQENPLDESSFFQTYFKKKENELPIQRDFDTSRQFEDLDSSDSEQEPKCIVNRPDELADNESENESAVEKKKCNECSKLIPKTEFLTHMDHHYALQIYKEESHIHNSSFTKKKQIVSKSKSTTTTKVKRKYENCLKLTSFLEKKEITSEEPIELCSQCNKRVPLTELNTHSDYHAAKKLHLELNPVKVSSLNPSKRVKQSGQCTVTSYFKHM